GQAVGGELAETDPQTGNGSSYDAWSFTAVEGRTYRITLRSEDFDAYLWAGPRAGGVCEPCLADDDGGDDDMDAELVFRAVPGGPHLILASALSQGESGLYTLTLQEAAPLDQPVPVGSTVIPTGAALPRLPPSSVHDDTLRAGDYVDEDGGLVDVYTYAGSEERLLYFSVYADFDAELRVGAREGGTWRELKRSTTPARRNQISVAFPRRGEYEVRVRGAPGQSGAYTLSTFPVWPETDSLPPPGTIAPGQLLRGLLDGKEERGPDSMRVENWEIAGGRTVTIDLRSDWFDPVLRVLAQEEDVSWREIGRDDDGGVGVDSRLTIHLPLPGRYRIQVTTVYPAGNGFYLLQVREGVH
ncbi:MAG TPA: hypothetical protein VFY65_14050, partial [Longimicrobium sp.]|nr:hypothetical protein [Longimicrobium sp.]